MKIIRLSIFSIIFIAIFTISCKSKGEEAKSVYDKVLKLYESNEIKSKIVEEDLTINEEYSYVFFRFERPNPFLTDAGAQIYSMTVFYEIGNGRKSKEDLENRMKEATREDLLLPLDLTFFTKDNIVVIVPKKSMDKKVSDLFMSFVK